MVLGFERGGRAQVPLPQLAEELLEERVADVAARAALAPEAPPSVAFFTFVNTHQSLNAVAFSPDGGWVIGARRAYKLLGFRFKVLGSRPSRRTVAGASVRAEQTVLVAYVGA